MKTREEKITDFLNSLEFEHLCIMDYVNADEVNSFQDVYEALEDDGAFNVEIIYYSRAMEYLMEHDTSLQESLSIASDMGYSPDDLNSEVLASLLASQIEMERFYKYEHEITEFFDNLEENEE